MMASRWLPPESIVKTHRPTATGPTTPARAGSTSAVRRSRSLQFGGLAVWAVALPSIALVGIALGVSAVSGARFVVIGLAWALIAVIGAVLVKVIDPVEPTRKPKPTTLFRPPPYRRSWATTVPSAVDPRPTGGTSRITWR